MAADTREDAISKPPVPSKPTTSPSKGTAHEPYAVPVAPPNANALPGGAGLNTAGGRTKEAGYFDALRSIQFSDFQEVHKKPCVRDALLTGIGGGFGIGGVRAVLGASVWTTCNSAVGSFVFGSFLMYEYCQRRRYLEMQGMKRAVEVIDRKQAEKQKKAEEARAARRKAKEES
ncbi:hypothetical protein HO173_006352 [Letharia columbiana]|uniref:Cytochrome c oxidase assembly protein COX20, mitochondrial n=1 Tax=Letharia columbiana TaxID=112416 RepID=A0A8H6L4Y8_9LECA|nr:uncharacterized protein HO173_006352 [Letharia columbiana]KAF6235669.1 hypothetical protein HO173_006352 [Letharia columbiana]